MTNAHLIRSSSAQHVTGLTGVTEVTGVTRVTGLTGLSKEEGNFFADEWTDRSFEGSTRGPRKLSVRSLGSLV